MRFVVELFGVLCFLGGIALLVLAATTPGKYVLSTASAVQISQVYSEATFYGVLSGAIFLCGCFIVLSLKGKPTD